MMMNSNIIRKQQEKEPSIQLICLKNMNNLNGIFEFAKNDLNSKYLSENIKKKL